MGVLDIFAWIVLIILLVSAVAMFFIAGSLPARRSNQEKYQQPANSLPFDFSVGRSVSKDLTVSLEIGVPIIKDYPVYDFKTTTRINMKF